MSRVFSHQPLVPSILDRLMDENPGATREPVKSRTQVLRELKQSVRRDLENLLNTRCRCKTWPSNLTELRISLANYGIPDITGTNLSTDRQREEFRRTMEEVIRNFEPRFQSVRVEILDNSEPMDRMLRFRIDALLHAAPQRLGPRGGPRAGVPADGRVVASRARETWRAVGRALR